MDDNISNKLKTGVDEQKFPTTGFLKLRRIQPWGHQLLSYDSLTAGATPQTDHVKNL